MDHLIWGGEVYKLQNILYDPGIESAIPDFIIRSESAENDFFFKARLHSIYAHHSPVCVWKGGGHVTIYL